MSLLKPHCPQNLSSEDRNFHPQEVQNFTSSFFSVQSFDRSMIPIFLTKFLPPEREGIFFDGTEGFTLLKLLEEFVKVFEFLLMEFSLEQPLLKSTPLEV